MGSVRHAAAPGLWLGFESVFVSFFCCELLLNFYSVGFLFWRTNAA